MWMGIRKHLSLLVGRQCDANGNWEIFIPDAELAV